MLKTLKALQQKAFKNKTMPQNCAPNTYFLPIFRHFLGVFQANFE